MRLLYNILFLFFFTISAPFYFMKMRRRGHWRRNFGHRFGRYDSKFKQALTNRHVIWLHAVSVGEVNLCTQLIKALEPRVPQLKIVVSTTTSTGMEVLKKRLPAHIEKIYYPIDFKKGVSRAFKFIDPEAVVLVEAELWPNFIWKAAERRVPLFLVNARISERSARRYQRFGFLFRPLFEKFQGVGVQTEKDAATMKRLGFRPETIQVVGSMKYDAAQLDSSRTLDVVRLFDRIGFPKDAWVLLGSSTHAGEEKILGEIFLRLKKSFPRLRLVLVPRHFERGKEAGRDLEELGVRFVYRSQVTDNSRPAAGLDCLLVNTTGELKFFYEYSTVTFIGKSLTAEGGQSPIEAAAQANAMIFGPNMQNFPAIAPQFVREKGALQIQSASELESAARDLLEHPEKRKAMGIQAKKVVQQNLGAVEKTVEMIVGNLKIQ